MCIWSFPNFHQFWKGQLFDSGSFIEFFYNIETVARNRESGNTGRLQRNLYAILKFAEQHKNNDNS